MNREKRDRSLSNATREVPPSPDIAALEAAAEQLVRDGHISLALPLWTLALRLREEANRAPSRNG